MAEALDVGADADRPARSPLRGSAVGAGVNDGSLRVYAPPAEREASTMHRTPAAQTVPPPTLSLLLAEKWARHRRDPTSRGGAIFAGGGVEPVVQVHHGSVPIFVRDLGKCLMVLGSIDLPEEVRQRVRLLGTEQRGAFLSGLQEILMSCPRIGFGFGPAGETDVREVRRIVLDQTLQVAENDAASFNRFCDAIQETETILLRTAAYLHQFVAATEAPVRYSSGTPPPSELYL